MNVGIVGLGKLGLPVAYAMASKGLDVYGFDTVVTRPPDDLSREEGLADAVAKADGRVRFVDLDEIVARCDVVMVAVQTPHAPEFEGVTPLTDNRSDFDYVFLSSAVGQLAESAERQKRVLAISVVSTVLPGTTRRVLAPLLNPHVALAYSPSFIAMGTTIRDFLDPEFVLVGGCHAPVRKLYEHLTDAPIVETTIETAELTKVAYNTFIGLKIAMANTLMEVCHKTPGADVDAVTDALALAHRRLISPAYMRGGMGDGGGCHPRDNIALSWLARELGLSFDLFGQAMLCREQQTAWLASLVAQHDLPPAILGVAYKPGSHITTGSAALLAKHQLEQAGSRVKVCDPHVGVTDAGVLAEPHVYLVGCNHPEFVGLSLPEGSVVIDPWRYIPDQDGVEVIRVGEG